MPYIPVEIKGRKNPIMPLVEIVAITATSEIIGVAVGMVVHIAEIAQKEGAHLLSQQGDKLAENQIYISMIFSDDRAAMKFLQETLPHIYWDVKAQKEVRTVSSVRISFLFSYWKQS